MSKSLPYILIFVASLLFFSFRLIQVPRGLTIDEAAFGYNAVLLSQTLTDENGRFLPIFVLSIHGKDWRQPVTQYFMATFFRLFGPSVYNLRLTSVIIASTSTVLLFFLARQLIGNLAAIFSVIFFVTTPIVVIHTHMGLDNIAPIPFVASWLIFIHLFEKRKRLKYLVFAGLSLGVGFYSYKGMRVFAPTWSLLTLIYLALPFLKSRTKNAFQKVTKPILAFLLSIFPFYAIIPYLELKYAGAVLGQANLTEFESVYKFLYSYFSSFDPSFLFITGDEMLHHSTHQHGMFLLASLPFFILGLTQIRKKGKFWVFMAVSFFAGPLLFGFPGSVHRASRLLALVPLYSLISSLGAFFLWQKRKYQAVLATLIIILGINFYDFITYYWFSYADDTYHIFYQTQAVQAYRTLFEEAKKRNLTPLISVGIAKYEEVDDGVPNAFLRSIYFLDQPSAWDESQTFPDRGILMTENSDLKNLKRLDKGVNNYYFYVKD